MRTVLFCLVLGACGKPQQFADHIMTFDEAVADVRERVEVALGCKWTGVVHVSRTLLPHHWVGATVWPLAQPSNEYGSVPQIYMLPIVDLPMDVTDTSDDYVGIPPEQFRLVLVHEFGHAAGLSHSPDPSNIMYRNSPENLDLDTAITQMTATLHCPQKIALFQPQDSDPQ